MSQGKYSPNLPKQDDAAFAFNCYGKPPVPVTVGVTVSAEYHAKNMYDAFDSEGFDSYGYSCFNAAGEYVGLGMGVDRNGKTESDYMDMSEEEFESYL